MILLLDNKENKKEEMGQQIYQNNSDLSSASFTALLYTFSTTHLSLNNDKKEKNKGVAVFFVTLHSFKDIE